MTFDSAEIVWFRRVCRFVAVFPIVLGGAVAPTGVAGFEVLFDVEVGDVDPTLASAVRFLATAFFGMGMLLLWASRDIVGRAGALRIFFAAMILGALARLLGAGVDGTPNVMSLVLIGIELTGVPMWLWHRRILGSSGTPGA